MKRVWSAVVALGVALVLPLPAGTPAVASAPAGSDLGGFTSLAPVRLLDTRTTHTPLGPGATRDVVVAGRGGVPSTGVTAVAINLTAVHPTTSTSLTAYAGGTPRPSTVTLTSPPARNIAEAAVVKVGNGRITLYNSAGTTDVIVDISGWYGRDPATGLRYEAKTPERVLDSRESRRFNDGETRRLQIYPAESRGAYIASAVALSVVATNASAEGYLSVYPAGQTRPNVSSLNYRAGQTIANLVVVKLAGNGVDIYVSKRADVVIDRVGFFGGRGNGRYSPVTPTRIVDTRFGLGAPQQQLGPGDSLTLQVTDTAGVPARLPSAVAVAVTAVKPSANGFLTVYPGGTSRPLASNINTTAGQTITGTVLAKVDLTGRITIYAQTGTVDLMVEVVGWYDRPAVTIPLNGIGHANNSTNTADLVLSKDQRTAYVSAPESGQIHVIDVETGAVQSHDFGGLPSGLALTADERTLWVAQRSSQSLVALDTTTFVEVRRIPIRVGGNQYPYDIALPPDEQRAFVTLSFAGTGYGGSLISVDLTTGQEQSRDDLKQLGMITEGASFASTPDRSIIEASDGADGGKLLRWESGDDTWRFVGYTMQHPLAHLAISDNADVALSTDGGNWTAWRREADGSMTPTVRSLPHAGSAVALDAAGTTGYALDIDDLHVFDMQDGTPLDVVHTEDNFDYYGYFNNHRLMRTSDGSTLLAVGLAGLTIIRM
ncbi:MAG: hypothetical protein QOJ79_1425 [Actinomycetota bacterium]|jgi:hypothetical protein|nr:hypothetical protein [Actinomycetota bacterium]